MKLFEKIIGAVLFSTLMFMLGHAIGGMAEQGVSDSERYAHKARLDELNSRADDVYISPSDEVLIELIKGADHERP